MRLPCATQKVGMAVLTLALAWSGPVQAHFGMVIPSLPTLTEEHREADITLSFSHPFEGAGMELKKPKRFFMVVDGLESDLSDRLEPATVMENAGFRYRFSPARPGVYHFVMEPEPYWEPAEDSYIIHYTKTVLGVFGAEDKWMEPLGLPVEIKPLLRPFGNYQGNSFTGQVLIDGAPAAAAEVEVEYYDRERRFAAPTGYHITQVLRTDGNGVFSFTCPVAGWWGFASLATAAYTLKGPDNTDKEVEIGGVLWIHLDEYRPR